MSLHKPFGGFPFEQIYAESDKQIKATYIKKGTAQNQIAVYDMYTRFYIMASDRTGKNSLESFAFYCCCGKPNLLIYVPNSLKVPA